MFNFLDDSSPILGEKERVNAPSVNPRAGETNLVANDAKDPETGMYDAISPLSSV